MALTLGIDDRLTSRLEEEAHNQGLPVSELVNYLLERALRTEEISMTPKDLVARLRRETHPHPLDEMAHMSSDRVALLETLRSAPIDPDFDLEAWNNEWAAAESEIRRIDRMGDWAEGRG